MSKGFETPPLDLIIDLANWGKMRKGTDLSAPAFQALAAK